MTYEEFDKYLKTLPGKKRRALQYAADCSSMQEIADALKVGQSTLYHWRHIDPDYNEAFKFALELGIEELEDIAVICAKKALDNSRYQMSLWNMLKARRRTIYGDHVVQEVVDHRPPLKVELVDTEETEITEETEETEIDTA
mgnify:CR=1 FL=1